MEGPDLVDIVDESGRVVDTVTRAEMRARNLRHRAVGVLVRTAGGDVVVHRRSDWKDVWPGYWDLAFGGVLQPGEDWIDGARRELAEEAGIEAALDVLGTGTYEDDDVRVVGRIFVATHDGPFTFVDGEVDRIELVPWEQLRAWTSRHRCCPDTLSMVLPLLPD
ncbi:MAG TPA: NUDIX domain-containing protein [Acidimicrobiales bacterium]|nr:NUDIX domain-containing protein [Acidimicrobiales bacterium]